jgi:hypothetical protein
MFGNSYYAPLNKISCLEDLLQASVFENPHLRRKKLVPQTDVK